MIMSRARCTLYVLSAALLAAAVPAVAKPYPVNVCVSRKQQDAGDYCRRVLKAWATWDRTQDAARRDNKIAVASATLGLGWAKAEAQSSNVGVDCGDTTSSAAQMTGAIDSATGAIVAAVNAGLDLGDKSNARCGGNLLQAAARKCARLLGAESDFVRNLARDQHATRRDAAKARISETFTQAYNRQRRLGCPTAATGSGLETLIDGAVARVVTDTTVSPNVSSTDFTTIPASGTTTYLGKSLTPICMNGSPYEFFVKRGSVNKLLVYYQGGGACWDSLTCSVPVCDTSVNDGDNPAHATPGSPIRAIRATRSATGTSSSCRTAAATSTSATPRRTIRLHVEHRGYDNSRIVEKWAREHFVNPDAGLRHRLERRRIRRVVQCAAARDGVAGVALPGPRRRGQRRHHAGLPGERLPALELRGEHPDATIPGVLDVAHRRHRHPRLHRGRSRASSPRPRWAHYATAFDGGTGGQTGFYNIMLNNNDPARGAHLVERQLRLQRRRCARRRRRPLRRVPSQLSLLHRHRLAAHDVGLATRSTTTRPAACRCSSTG